MIVFMYIRQREPAKIVSKEWKLTIVFLRGLNVVSPEGNGRTARAFMNVQLVRAGLTPFYIKVEEKKGYIAALEKADTEKNYADLYECIFKVIIRSHVELSKNSL